MLGRNEHNEAEGCGVGWRNAVGVGNKLHDRDATVFAQSSVTFLEKSHAGRRVEVVEEIREKNEVVVVTEVDFKRAAFDGAEAVGELHALGVFASDLQDWRPIERDNLSARVALGKAQA